MTSTEFSIGMGDGRNSSKVLKPPGGGSSNIFGAVNSEKVVPVKANQTKDRLFGTTNPEPATPTKLNKMKSDIFANQGQTSPKQQKKYVRHNPITGEVIEIDLIKNGETKEEIEERSDPEAEQNGDAHDAPEAEMPAPPLPEPVKNPKPTSVRVRQPPGGKSSGIF